MTRATTADCECCQEGIVVARVDGRTAFEQCMRQRRPFVVLEWANADVCNVTHIARLVEVAGIVIG